MEGESGVTRSVIDELHSWNIKGGQKEGEIGVTGSIMDEVHYSDIQRDQMESASGVSRNIMHELHSWDIRGDRMEGESMVLLELSLMNFIIAISSEIIRKVKMVLFEVS